MAFVTLINNTSSTSLIGRVVKLNPSNKQGFVYASAVDTDALGVVAEHVPKKSPCKIITSGEALVYVYERVALGSSIRLGKPSDNISQGTCKSIKTTDAPYLKIGTALESGKGLIRCTIAIFYLYTDVEFKKTEIGGIQWRYAVDTSWKDLITTTGLPGVNIILSPTEPTNPTPNTIWIDTSIT